MATRTRYTRLVARLARLRISRMTGVPCSSLLNVSGRSTSLRHSAPEPRNEVDLPETFKSELHGTPVILDIRNLAKRATNLVYLVRVAIGQRCQAPTGVRD